MLSGRELFITEAKLLKGFLILGIQTLRYSALKHFDPLLA